MQIHFIFLAGIAICLFFSSSSEAWQQNPPPPYYASSGYAPSYYQPYRPPVRYNTYPGYYYQVQPPQRGYIPSENQLRRSAPGNKVKTQKPNQSPQTTEERKQVFVEKLLPYINEENARLKYLRSEVIQVSRQIQAGYTISNEAENRLLKLAKKYRVSSNPLEEHSARMQLIKKIDIIPASLALAQAANESAWGNSRFSTQANNLFGIWTYDKNKGLIPEQRDSGQKHLVRKFAHQGESIRYYMHLLNSHPAYQKLRDIRSKARSERKIPNGMAMAAGLEKYSSRGRYYIELIQQLIRQNQWARLDRQTG